jgi:hypothetical protein
MTTPHSKRKSPIRGGREETNMISLLITLFPSITLTCQILPLTLPYPLARLPVSMGRTIANGNIASKIIYTLFTPKFDKLFVMV